MAKVLLFASANSLNDDETVSNFIKRKRQKKKKKRKGEKSKTRDLEQSQGKQISNKGRPQGGKGTTKN